MSVVGEAGVRGKGVRSHVLEAVADKKKRKPGLGLGSSLFSGSLEPSCSHNKGQWQEGVGPQMMSISAVHREEEKKAERHSRQDRGGEKGCFRGYRRFAYLSLS